jgi:hypothetical protein
VLFQTADPAPQYKLLASFVPALVHTWIAPTGFSENAGKMKTWLDLSLRVQSVMVAEDPPKFCIRTYVPGALPILAVTTA